MGTGITFTKTDDKNNSKLNISWHDQSGDNVLHFDGQGGELARAGSDPETKIGFIQLDVAEKWYLQSQINEAKENYYALLPVILHEMGHVLGMGHSQDISAVMT